MNCTGCPEEIQAAFSLSLDEATGMAAREAPGCEGVNVLPYFTGERTPDWPHARGSILGLTPGMLQRPGLLYRAAIEGSTFSLASGIALYAPTCRESIHTQKIVLDIRIFFYILQRKR